MPLEKDFLLATAVPMASSKSDFIAGLVLGGQVSVTDRRGLKTRYKGVLERLSAGDISRRRAARELGIGYATLKRLLDGELPAGYL